MGKRLPPLNSIRAFEVAGRTLKISTAADELHVTRGAVSKQIKALESFLNIELFIRSKAGIELTEEGSIYLKRIQNALNEITFATEEIQERDTTQHLTIQAPSTFASLWLIANLSKFYDHFPEMHLDIVTQTTPFEDNREASLIIKEYPLHYAPTEATLLKPEVLKCLIKPSLVTDHQLKATALADFPLINITERKNIWNDAYPTQTEEHINKQIKHNFPSYLLGVEAAKQGLGVCVLPDFLVESATRDHNLVVFKNITLNTGYGYFAHLPTHMAQHSSTQQFHDWLSRAMA